MEGHDHQPAQPVRFVEPSAEAADVPAHFWGQTISRAVIDLGLPVEKGLTPDSALTVADVVERDLATIAKLWPLHAKALFKIVEVAGRQFDRAAVARNLRERLSAMIAGPMLARLTPDAEDDDVREAFISVGTPVIERHMRAGLVSALRVLAHLEGLKLVRAPERDELTRRQARLEAEVESCQREGRRGHARRLSEELESVEAQKSAIPKYDLDRHRRCAWLAVNATHPIRGTSVRAMTMYHPAADNPGPLVPALAVLSTSETVEITDCNNPNAVYRAASELRSQLDHVDELEPTVALTAPGEVWTSL